MCNINHVVGIHDSERNQSVSYDSEQGNENVVNDVDDIFLSGTANTDPA